MSVKLEAFNPGSSVKDRIALSMIEKAERDGLVSITLVLLSLKQPAGNTGIGLSRLGLPAGIVVIVMPEKPWVLNVGKSFKLWSWTGLNSQVVKGMKGAYR